MFKMQLYVRTTRPGMDAAAASCVSHSLFLIVPISGIAPMLEREAKQFLALTVRRWHIQMRPGDNQLH